MKIKQTPYLLMLVMAMVVIVVTGISIWSLYVTAFEQEQRRLLEVVQSRARMIEAVAHFDAIHSNDAHPDGAIAATLSQVIEANRQFRGFGETGEFTLAKQEGSEIVFLLSNRHLNLDAPRPVPMKSDLAEPMRRALNGISGTVTALDYRGSLVLAAHEPIEDMGWGVVAKIDLAEVRKPFIQASIISIFAAVLMIGLGGGFFLLIARPLIRRLEDGRSYNRMLFDTSPIGLVLCKMDGEIVDVNAAFAAIIGRTIEETKRLSYWDITPEKYARDEQAQLIRLNQDGCYGPYEKEYIHKDGRLVPVRLSGQTIDRKGEAFIWSSVEDITEQKRAEQEKEQLQKQLQQAQKMESIGQLTGGIAHDFNNMLSAILGYTYISISDRAVDPESKLAKHLLEIQHAGERGRDLVVKMLAFGRTSIDKLQAVDGASHITNVIQLLRSTLPSSLIIDIDVSDKVPPVLADPTQLDQVLINLIINAHHAIGDDGKIELSIHGPCHQEGVCSSCHHLFSGEFIEINVRNYNDGIPLDVVSRIFEPFYTTKGVGKGSGLGLSMVHGILHQCKGHILVETEQNVGSNFRLFFQPASTEDLAVVANQIMPPVSVIDNKCIMVVDDEEGITGYLTELLSGWGYQVRAYNDPLVAMEAFKYDASAIDLVITDQTMPNFTGAKLAQKLLSLRPSLPVILCTGYSESINEESAKHLGIAVFLKKPVDSDEFLKAIAKLLS